MVSHSSHQSPSLGGRRIGGSGREDLDWLAITLARIRQGPHREPDPSVGLEDPEGALGEISLVVQAAHDRVATARTELQDVALAHGHCLSTPTWLMADIRMLPLRTIRHNSVSRTIR